MPLAPAIAAALTTPNATAHLGLYVNGLDVSAEPAATKRYGVDWGTVRLHLASAGGVSRLTLDVDDPFNVLSFAPGDEIRLEWSTGAIGPFFRGSLEIDEAASDFGTLGRSWSLTATGDDGIPDWVATEYSLTFAAVTTLDTMIQAIVAACPNTGPLNTAVTGLTAGDASTPIGAIDFSVLGPGALPPGSGSVTIAAGTTMRQAVAAALAACNSAPGTTLRFTIDMTRGVRAWTRNPGGGPLLQPDGDVPWTITTAADPRPARDRHRTDGMTIVRTVIVRGTGVTATVSDGSGKRGRTAVVTDATLTTVAACRLAGLAYLEATGAGITGSFVLEDVADGSVLDARPTRRRIVLTIAATGASGTYEVTGLDITFNGALQPTATVAYGTARPASAAELIRQLIAVPIS